ISLGSSVPSPEPRFYSPDGSKRPFKTHRSFVPNREGFLQRAVSKAPRPDHHPTPESLICRGASDTVLGVLGNSSGLVAFVSEAYGSRSKLPHHQPAAGRLKHRHHERSEEHTSELQSPCNLVCRLLLEKKKKNNKSNLFISDRFFSPSRFCCALRQ